MAKTKAQLTTENNTNFPNNNSQFITPEKLRGFNQDMIDSTVNQDIYNADSASFDTRIDNINVDTGSLLVTASFNDGTRNMTFTKGDSSTFDVSIPAGTAVLPSGVVSGSSQIILQDTTGNLSGSRIDGLVASASYAISSSHSEFADDATNSTFSVYADNTIVYGKNLHSTTIAKGTPLYFTGSGTAGNLVGILPADAGNPARMPAGGVAGESIIVGEEGIILLDGFINEVDTTAFAPGDEVFVGVGGGYTNVVPTGSNNLIQSLGYVEKSAVNGSGVIQMSGEARGVPNIQEGYAWVGDSNGVATPATTQSIVEHIFTQNNTFTGTQTFDNIAVNGTGSFAYIQSITGSAKIIGDAFIILNNDLPTERYAGIVVQDSGSGSPLTTASLQFDGQTNDWFYEYSDDGGVTADHGVVLFGPEYSTKGTPTYPTTNVIQKGTGGHHLTGSSITDDGSLVTINANITANGFVGNGLVSGSSQITSSLDGRYAVLNGSNQFNGNQVVTGSLYQVFDAPATETQTDLIRINNASVSGKNYNNASFNIQNYPSFGPLYEDTFIIEYWDSFSYNYGTEFNLNGGNVRFNLVPSGSALPAFFSLEDLYNGNSRTSVQGSIINIGTSTTSTNSITIGRSALPQLNLRAEDVVINCDTIDITTTNVSLTGSLEIENDLTVRGLNTILSSSLKVQDISIFDGLATFNAGATVNLPLILSGSVRTKVGTIPIASQTASIDFSDTSMFELTLVSGSTTHLDATNINKGQTINVLVKQPSVGTGLISFSPEFLQPSGSEYTPTDASDAQDILTLVTFSDTNKVYVANVKQLV